MALLPSLWAVAMGSGLGKVIGSHYSEWIPRASLGPQGCCRHKQEANPIRRFSGLSIVVLGYTQATSDLLS